MGTPSICPACKSKKINKKPTKTWTIGSKIYKQLWECKDCGADKREIKGELPKYKKGKKLKKGKKKK